MKVSQLTNQKITSTKICFNNEQDMRKINTSLGKKVLIHLFSITYRFIATEWCRRTLEEHANIAKESQQYFLTRGSINNPDDQLIDRELKERTILRQVTEGLAYLHYRSKVVHGNIKPSNIFIFKEGGKWTAPLVKLADYSAFCKFFEKENNDKESLTAMSWKSPESYEPFADGELADIFSLGCIFGFVLSKKWEHPFGEDSLLRLTSSSQLKGFYDEDDSTLKFIQAMVDDEPNKRPSLINILEHEFWNKYVPIGDRIEPKKSVDDIFKEPFALYNHLSHLHTFVGTSDDSEWIKMGKMAYNKKDSLGKGSFGTEVYSGFLILNCSL